MAEITLRGNPIHTSGELPAVGSPAPAFTLTGGNLADVTPGDFAGKRVSRPTSFRASTPASVRPACGRSTRRPSCVPTPSCSTCRPTCRSPNRALLRRRGHRERDVGLVVPQRLRLDLRRDDRRRPDGRPAPARLSSSSGPDGNVAYTEQVPEIGQEPDYDAALAAVGLIRAPSKTRPLDRVDRRPRGLRRARRPGQRLRRASRPIVRPSCSETCLQARMTPGMKLSRCSCPGGSSGSDRAHRG